MQPEQRRASRQPEDDHAGRFSRRVRLADGISDLESARPAVNGSQSSESYEGYAGEEIHDHQVGSVPRTDGL